MKNLLVLIVVFAAMTGCAKPERTLSLKLQPGMSPDDVRLAERGVKMLFDACPGVGRYWDDLSAPSAVHIREASLTDQREQGWKRSVEIELLVSNSPTSIPPAYRAMGHHCYFDVATDAPFGVSIAKSACLALCRDKPTKESLAFIPASP